MPALSTPATEPRWHESNELPTGSLKGDGFSNLGTIQKYPKIENQFAHPNGKGNENENENIKHGPGNKEETFFSKENIEIQTMEEEEGAAAAAREAAERVELARVEVGGRRGRWSIGCLCASYRDTEERDDGPWSRQNLSLSCPWAGRKCQPVSLWAPYLSTLAQFRAGCLFPEWAGLPARQISFVGRRPAGRTTTTRGLDVWWWSMLRPPARRQHAASPGCVRLTHTFRLG